MKNGEIFIMNEGANVGTPERVMLMEDVFPDDDYVDAYDLKNKIKVKIDAGQLKEFYHKKGQKMSVKKGGRFTKNHFSLPKQKIEKSDKINDMITIKNILTEYPKIDQSILPEPLKAEEFKYVNENIHFYGHDEDIDLYLNTFVEKLNLILSKSKKADEKDEKNEPKIETKVKMKKKDQIKESHSFKPKYKPRQRVIWTSSKGTKHHGIIVSVDEANPGTYLFRGDDWNGVEDNVNESGLKKEGKKPKQVKERKTEPKGVGHVDLQVSFIKSFVLMQGKTKTKEQILNLYRRIEKSAIELKIRKTSQYADQITYIVNFLKDSYNDKKYTIGIPKGKYDELHKIAYSEKQQGSVLFIKRYLGLFGKDNIEDKAKALLETIKMTIKSGKITKDDIHFDTLESIQENLEGFLLKSKKLFPENFDLKGLMKLSGSKLSLNINHYIVDALTKTILKKFAGTEGRKRAEEFIRNFEKDNKRSPIGFELSVFNDEMLKNAQMNTGQYFKDFDYSQLKKKSEKEPFKKKITKSFRSKKALPEHVAKHVPEHIKKAIIKSTPETIDGIKLPPGVIPSNKLKTMEFETIKLKGDWSKLIGEPTKPFHIMIYGTGGMGKSTQSIYFAKYMASEHGFKVLYVAKEEGIGNTIKEKFGRLHAFDSNIFLVENEIPKDLSYFDLIVLDSVNELDMSPDGMRELQEKNSTLSTLQIFKVRKDGVFLGESDFKHLCQAELVCEQGYCHSVKNRFGGNEWLKIKDFKYNDASIKDLKKEEKEKSKKVRKKKEIIA